MKLLKLTVDLEAATKEELISQLKDLIWEVKTTDTGRRRKPGVDRNTWRRLTDLDRAQLAQEYIDILGDARIASAPLGLANARGWSKSFASDCIVRLRGHGYLTPASEAPALTDKAKKELLLAEHAAKQETVIKT